ncbi:MAG: ABC transporter permease [Actinobacteria bacterium]|nr:MAG: ABC transporter permease [Actinomycetota bacterium]
MTAIEAPAPHRTIRIQRTGRRLPLTLHDLRELWAYHELMFFLVWRDVKVKYKQTALGAAWAILVPFSQMVVFTLLFNQALHVKSEYHVPYPLFVFTAMLPWTYFTSCLSASSASIVGNQNLITKVFFPRLIIPLAAVVAPVIDFLLAFTVLVGMFLYYGRAPHWHLVVIPAFLGMALLTAFGVGLWLSALNVRYRDVPFIVPYLTQIWFFVTPIVYGVTALKPRTQELIALNPMAGVIDGFRWAVLGRGLPHYHVYAVSFGIALGVMLSGIWYFRRVERYFADLI